MTDTERLDWLLAILHPDEQHEQDAAAKFSALRHQFNSQKLSGRECIDAAMTSLK